MAGHGLSGPEFRPQYHKKNKKRMLLALFKTTWLVNVALTLELTFGSPSDVLSLKTSKDTSAARELAVLVLELWFLLNRYHFLMQKIFLRGNVPLCVHFYQMEPLGLFYF
jgi:hypothetical protein